MRNSTWIVSTVVSIGAIAGIGAAAAADLPARTYSKAAATVVDQAYSWAGFYIGVNDGYTWGTDRITGAFAAPAPFVAIDVAAISAGASARLGATGYTGGGQAGYNWQMGAAVFGFEADIDAFHLRGTTTGTFPFPSTLPGGVAGPPTAFFSPTSSLSTDWLFTGRGRIGWANDHWLLYATGGVAVTNLNVNQSIALLAPFAFNTTATSTRVGYTVGAGFEYAFNTNWSVKAEYLYLDFGTLNGVGGLTPALAGLTYTNSTHLTSNLERVGVNYHFGGPVVAKY